MTHQCGKCGGDLYGVGPSGTYWLHTATGMSACPAPSDRTIAPALPAEVEQAIEWLEDETRNTATGETQDAIETLLAHLRSQPAPRLVMGDGDYSCASCGMGMREPCEHWKEFLARNGMRDCFSLRNFDCK